MSESGSHRATLVSGSPSATSRSRRLLVHAGLRLDAAGFTTTTVDLALLSADGLLGRGPDAAVAAAIDSARTARILVVSSPVYRATYTGLLKTFFDLFPPDSLTGVVAVPILTGAGPAHALAVDHGLRPMLGSLGALVVANGVYGTDAQLGPDGPAAPLLERVDRAVAEAVALARLRNA